MHIGHTQIFDFCKSVVGYKLPGELGCRTNAFNRWLQDVFDVPLIIMLTDGMCFANCRLYSYELTKGFDR